MKKLMLAVAVFAVSSVSFAMCPNPANAGKIYHHIEMNNQGKPLPTVELVYTSDNADWATKMESALKDKGLSVKLSETQEGSNVCRLEKTE